MVVDGLVDWMGRTSVFLGIQAWSEAQAQCCPSPKASSTGIPRYKAHAPSETPLTPTPYLYPVIEVPPLDTTKWPSRQPETGFEAIFAIAGRRNVCRSRYHPTSTIESPTSIPKPTHSRSFNSPLGNRGRGPHPLASQFIWECFSSHKLCSYFSTSTSPPLTPPSPRHLRPSSLSLEIHLLPHQAFVSLVPDPAPRTIPNTPLPPPTQWQSTTNPTPRPSPPPMAKTTNPKHTPHP